MQSGFSKLLQIIVNLVTNAKESLIEDTENKNKQVIVSLKKNLEDNKIVLSIKDNGSGIREEDLTKIFSFGYTTKEGGHGYGLHSAGLTAQELGGALHAESEGPGKGAVFTLTLPGGPDGQFFHEERIES